jgi:hypothetical protein
MKITRKKLNMLIESYLKESDEKTVPGDKFADMLDKQQKKQEKNIQAVTDFRKGSDRGQFPPLTFGPGVDDEGNLKDGKFTTVHDYHEPDPYDHGAVRRYKKQHYLGPDDKSVDDPEITRIGLEDDEDTEESPFGTQYSLDATDPQFRMDDRTLEDDGFTAHSGDDFYLEDEYDEDYEESEDYTEEDTLYDVDDDSEDEGLIAKIRKFFSGKK